ncbi:septum site-determining protein MinC [Gammaproteobacteria bacterium]|nr:septum site-determining protein MinC [Gammaproteobacteria bacterium]
MEANNIRATKQSLLYLNLTPFSTDSHIFIEALKKIKPKKQLTAVTIDLKPIKSLESPAWFRSIRSTLKQHNMTLIGIYNPQLNLEICKALKIPVLCEIHQQLAEASDKHPTVYISRPVRTGQQIYAKYQSVVLNKSLSAGAEIAAKENIYIFGSAQGKVIAGAAGDTTARIFISKGFPEMISIAGTTLISDQINPIMRPSQFYLNNGQLTQEIL